MTDKNFIQLYLKYPDSVMKFLHKKYSEGFMLLNIVDECIEYIKELRKEKKELFEALANESMKNKKLQERIKQLHLEFESFYVEVEK